MMFLVADPNGESAQREPWREVHCEYALGWMERARVLRGCSLITSLPDASELPELSLEEWKRWFAASARRVVASCPPEGVAIFYQTDIKREGTWVDKGYLVSRGAEECGAALLWHKVVCRRPPGAITYGRPAYAHLLCFSAGVRDAVGHSTADVL